jgi:hypothetical protein
MFAPGYNLSSNVHAFAAAKERMLARKNPELATIGLTAGFFQAISIRGIAAITAATTESVSAHVVPFENQSIRQSITNPAMSESKDFHPVFPLQKRTIVVVDAPNA